MTKIRLEKCNQNNDRILVDFLVNLSSKIDDIENTTHL
jgi:hypothetical protein